jgi:hypothetical protein
MFLITDRNNSDGNKKMKNNLYLKISNSDFASAILVSFSCNNWFLCYFIIVQLLLHFTNQIKYFFKTRNSIKFPLFKINTIFTKWTIQYPLLKKLNGYKKISTLTLENYSLFINQ